jgi:hypothetical protein
MKDITITSLQRLELSKVGVDELSNVIKDNITELLDKGHNIMAIHVGNLYALPGIGLRENITFDVTFVSANATKMDENGKKSDITSKVPSKHFEDITHDK